MNHAHSVVRTGSDAPVENLLQMSGRGASIPTLYLLYYSVVVDEHLVQTFVLLVISIRQLFPASPVDCEEDSQSHL